MRDLSVFDECFDFLNLFLHENNLNNAKMEPNIWVRVSHEIWHEILAPA